MANLKVKCIKDIVMQPLGDLAFVEGKTYDVEASEDELYFYDEFGHEWVLLAEELGWGFFKEHFRFVPTVA